MLNYFPDTWFIGAKVPEHFHITAPVSHWGISQNCSLGSSPTWCVTRFIFHLLGAYCSLPDYAPAVVSWNTRESVVSHCPWTWLEKPGFKTAQLVVWGASSVVSAKTCEVSTYGDDIELGIIRHIHLIGGEAASETQKQCTSHSSSPLFSSTNIYWGPAV